MKTAVPSTTSVAFIAFVKYFLAYFVACVALCHVRLNLLGVIGFDTF